MRPIERLLKNFLSPKLKEYRTGTGLSQEALAEKLGISTRSYSDLERGICNVSAATLMIFLAVLPEKESVKLIGEFRTRLKESDEHSAA